MEIFEYLENGTLKKSSLIRILAVFGFIFLLIATINNFTQGVDHEPISRSILYPATNILIPALNIFCLILIGFVMIYPDHIRLAGAILFIEAAHLILTSFHYIGIILYLEGLVLLFSFGYAREGFIKKAVFFGILLFLLLLTLIPSYGLHEFLFCMGFSSFSIMSYIIIYKILADKLSFLLGDFNVPDIKPLITLPEKGSTLNLKNLGLSERLVACVHYTVESSKNYKQIAEELLTSESTIKKDMQELYRLFGVKNREMLRLVLVQYVIV